MTPRKQSRRRSGAGGCITSASRRAEKSLSSTKTHNKSVRFQTTRRPSPSRAQNTRLRAFLQNAERSRRYHHHHQRSSSSATMMMIRSSSSSSPLAAKSNKSARLTKRVLKSSSLCVFLKCFFCFLRCSFPPFSRKQKKKKEKKKRQVI